MEDTFIVVGETSYYSDKETEIIGLTDDLLLAQCMIKSFEDKQENYIKKVNDTFNEKINSDKKLLTEEKFRKKYRNYRLNSEGKWKFFYNKTRFRIVPKEKNKFSFKLKEDFDLESLGYDVESSDESTISL